MKLNDFIYMPYSDSRDDYRDDIASAAIKENWGQQNAYLYAYVRDNFEILYSQGKVIEDPQKRYCLFRVGTLVTREGEPLTVLGVKNTPHHSQPYVYKKLQERRKFRVRIDNEDIHLEAPDEPTYEIPDYYRHYNLTYNFSHYLDDHESRVEERFPKLSSHQRFLCIYAALELAHRRGTQSAVAQWYCDKNAESGGYQWLLPLHITSENISEKPDFVATLDPNEDYSEYHVRTLVPPEWAYPHARSVSGRDPQFRAWA
jgi:hypothetical protein